MPLRPLVNGAVCLGLSKAMQGYRTILRPVPRIAETDEMILPTYASRVWIKIFAARLVSKVLGWQKRLAKATGKRGHRCRSFGYPRGPPLAWFQVST